jgi:hypothetical protein
MRILKASNVPALLNRLLATVASAARPNSNSWEKNFMLGSLKLHGSSGFCCIQGRFCQDDVLTEVVMSLKKRIKETNC